MFFYFRQHDMTEKQIDVRRKGGMELRERTEYLVRSLLADKQRRRKRMALITALAVLTGSNVFRELTLPAAEEDASRRGQIAGIAQSQLGYAESTRNFILSDDGGRHGCTRSGAM